MNIDEIKNLHSLISQLDNDFDLAFESLLNLFDPLLKSISSQKGYFDEDCYQECCVALFIALKRFDKNKI